jgi:hypothetical protein
MAKAVNTAREDTCSTCKFWDQLTPNPNEVLLGPYSKNQEFACRWGPVMVYKQGSEWCGQHRAKVG